MCYVCEMAHTEMQNNERPWPCAENASDNTKSTNHNVKDQRSVIAGG